MRAPTAARAATGGWPNFRAGGGLVRPVPRGRSECGFSPDKARSVCGRPFARADPSRRVARGARRPTLPDMTLESFLLWIAIGLIAGWLASAIVGGGYGVIGDIVVGIVGAFLGGLIMRSLHTSAPFGGLAGTIFVAFIGALVLLV